MPDTKTSISNTLVIDAGELGKAGHQRTDDNA